MFLDGDEQSSGVGRREIRGYSSLLGREMSESNITVSNSRRHFL